METIRIDTQGTVATVQLNRPQKRNAFDGVMLSELREAFEGFESAIKAVVLTGAGTAFCAGADLKWMADSAARQGPRRVRAGPTVNSPWGHASPGGTPAQ